MNPFALFFQVWLTRLAKTRAWTRLQHRRITRNRASRIKARVISVLALAASLVLVPVLTAFAGDGEGAPNPWMSAFGTKDSHGMQISAYSLSIDQGGATDPVKSATAFLLTIMWDTYRMWVSVALWLFDWALQFKFVDTLAAPLEMLAEALQRTTGQVHPVPMLLTLAGAFCGVWIMSGQAAKGIGGLLTALTAATLLTTALANPVAVISGEDGAINMAKEAGISLSSQVLTNGKSSSSDPEKLREHTSGALVDTFIRTPHQMINYGSVVDKDSKCVKVYDKELKKNTDPSSDDPRDAMGDCKKKYGEAAESPGTGLTGMVFLAPSGGSLALLVIIFAVALIIVTAIVLFEAAMITWNLLKAVGLPGAGTTALVVAVCVMFVGLGLLVALLFGAGVYLMLLKNLLTQEDNFVVSIVLLDLFLLIAAIILIVTIARARAQGRKLGEKVANGMNSPKPGNVGNSLGTARSVVSHAAAPLAATAMHRGAMDRGAQGPGGSQGGASPQPHRSGSTVAALAKGTGKATLGAAKIGLASTVGAPVYAPRAVGAGKKALDARRSRLQKRFADSKASVGSKVHKKTSDAKAFGQEYAHNVATAGRFAGRVSGAGKLGGLAAAGMGLDPVSGASAAAATATYFSGPKRAPQTTPRPSTSFYSTKGKGDEEKQPRSAHGGGEGPRPRPVPTSGGNPQAASPGPRSAHGGGEGPRPRPVPTSGGNPQAGADSSPTRPGGREKRQGNREKDNASAPLPRPTRTGGGNPQAEGDAARRPANSTPVTKKQPTDVPTVKERDLKQAQLEADRKAFTEQMKQRQRDRQRERREAMKPMSARSLNR